MEREIIDVLHRYCLAVDTVDEHEFRALWTLNATIDFGSRYKGEPAGFFATIRENRRGVAAMSHHVANIRIELATDLTSARSCCGVTAIVVPQSDSARNARLIRGNYHDDWLHTDGRWLIQQRRFEKILEVEL